MRLIWRLLRRGGPQVSPRPPIKPGRARQRLAPGRKVPAPGRKIYDAGARRIWLSSELPEWSAGTGTDFFTARDTSEDQVGEAGATVSSAPVLLATSIGRTES